LVFEFIDHTLLDEMENKSHGLEEEDCRKYVYQILRGLGFCHDNSVSKAD
jgi:cyclin-dependent kinase-like